MTPLNPNLAWYTKKTEKVGGLPRCPFASARRCPRYYQSLYLLGYAGSTKIDPVEDKDLHERWEQSDLWPITKEQETSILGNPSSQIFSNFCPEVTFDRFGLFASFLADYADAVDRDIVHARLGKETADRGDWRWQWASVSAMHYMECPLYSPLAHDASKAHLPPAKSGKEKIFNLRPSIYGLSLDIHALKARLQEWFNKTK